MRLVLGPRVTHMALPLVILCLSAQHATIGAIFRAHVMSRAQAQKNIDDFTCDFAPPFHKPRTTSHVCSDKL